jgi:hypothetical protein
MITTARRPKLYITNAKFKKSKASYHKIKINGHDDILLFYPNYRIDIND